MKQHPFLSVFLLLTFFLGGCIWGGFQTSEVLLVEIAAFPGTETWEVIISGEGETYLFLLGSAQKLETSLPEGLWTVFALARDGEDLVIANSPILSTTGRGILKLPLQSVAKLDYPKVTNFKRSGQDEVFLEWEVPKSLDLEAKWQIWRYQGPHWKLIGESEFGQTNFHYPHGKEGDFYGISLGDVSGPLSPLVGEVSKLKIVWEFQHQLPIMPVELPLKQQFAEPVDERDYFDLIAYFNRPTNYNQRRELLTEAGLLIKDELPELLAVLVEPAPTSSHSLVEWSTYRSDQFFIEPNWSHKILALPAKQDLEPWYLEIMKVPLAQAITKGKYSITIAVLDTGLNPEMLPASIRILPGYNFANNNEDTRDDYHSFHGTNVASLIGEVMPQVSIRPIKVLDHRGYGEEWQITKGLLYAADLIDGDGSEGAQIINLSLGQRHPLSTLGHRAFTKVVSETDALLIAASGNTASGVWEPGLYYPAAYPETVAVGAVAPISGTLSRAHYSHFGTELDLVAPAGSFAGTSFATAFVSGVTGLMLAKGHHAQDIRTILQETAIDLAPPGWDLEHGYGLVNAYWALQNVLEWDLTIKNHLNKIVQTRKIPLMGETEIFILPQATYFVEGWLKLKQSKRPSMGDHFAEEVISLTTTTKTINLVLREVF